jgi:hypothetical protein
MGIETFHPINLFYNLKFSLQKISTEQPKLFSSNKINFDEQGRKQTGKKRNSSF